MKRLKGSVAWKNIVLEQVLFWSPISLIGHICVVLLYACSLPEWESLFVQREQDQSYTIAFLASSLPCPHLLFPVLGIGLSRFLPHTPHDERISAQFCSKRGHELFPDWKNCLRCIFGFIEIVWRMFWNCDNSVFVWCWHRPTCQLYTSAKLSRGHSPLRYY